ncbi:MAG: LON peptidase substrate-binding domain-containing protein, partial [Acidobacteriota bacterium]
MEDLDHLPLPDVLPVLPLKDVVVFPYVIVPLSIHDEASSRAVDQALAEDRLLMLVSERERKDAEAPLDADDLHEIGTVGVIMRMLKLPDTRVRILVQGLVRARIESLGQQVPFPQARIATLDDRRPRRPNLKTEALMRTVRDGLEQAIHLGRSISPEVVVLAANLDDPGRLADLTASNLELEPRQAQIILESRDPVTRLRMVSEHLGREVQLLTMQHELENQARDEIDRSQREYFLRQQLRTIQAELGEADDFAAEIEAHRKLAVEKELSEAAIEELEKQIRRLERTHPDSAETTVTRTYLDWLTGLPWSVVSEDVLDLDHARTVLDEDHYNLEKIKERILEVLAVRKLKPDAKGPILCFVGPPGVGKTSLGRSIA